MGELKDSQQEEKSMHEKSALSKKYAVMKHRKTKQVEKSW